MEILIKAGQFLLSLSIIVALHELGHFIPAKLFKTRVDKFYLFFDIKFSLFKFKKGETEYGIGWLPLGGYVKIAGMVDESMDKGYVGKPMEDWEFRAKPAWQRLIIMTGGVIVNIILAFTIYAAVLFTWGNEKLPINSPEMGYTYHRVLKEQGLKDGDIITAVGTQKMEYYSDVQKALLISDYNNITALRDGREVEIVPYSDLKDSLLALGNKARVISPRAPYIVQEVSPNSPAAFVGIKTGDKILGTPENSNLDANAIVEVLDKEKAKGLNLIRSNANGTDTVFLKADAESGLVGILATNPIQLLETEKVEYGFFESFPAGIAMGTETLSSYIKSIPLLFSKEGAKQLGGFATIGSLFSPTWDWESFWRMTAFISIILGVMNILPIPALDGGHTLFLLIEMISGRKPSEKVLEYAQIVGLVIIGVLFIAANANDVVRFLF